MDSPPSTPPSTVPNEKDTWRFHNIDLPCEWIEAYHPGGYHPVHLGDVFKDGRYKVIRKLGDGSFSTVWLARDLSNNTYVALKITVSGKSETANELNILHYIAEMAPEASDHIVQLLDEFIHHGPNGQHKCLVFEPMGPSVNSMLLELPQFQIRRRHIPVRYPIWMVKSILKQSLQALALLHDIGIAHGDFQPGNMLFSLDGIDSASEDVLAQPEDEKSRSISAPVQRRDGKQDKWAPRYLCEGQPLVGYTNYVSGFKIKLSDMGGAYFFTDPPKKIVTPLGLRAPEMIFSDKVNRTFDVWSFGCLVFELLTGQPLFCVPYVDGTEDDDHLLALNAILGPLPDDIFNHWERSSLYFKHGRKLFNCQIGGVPEGKEPLMLEQKSMEDMFDDAKLELEKDEADQAKILIRRILQYNPEKRPSPRELLSDPWFAGIEG